MSSDAPCLRLQIDERIRVDGGQCPREIFLAMQTWALEAFNVDNPQYWAARNHRRPCKHLPQRLELAVVQDNQLELPRGANVELKKWLRQNAPDLAVSLEDKRSEPPMPTLQLQAELRPYQREAIAAAVKMRDGVIVAPTGSGKTMMAMGLIAQLGLRTLILVHTRTLLEQTCLVIEQTLGVVPGRFGGGEAVLADVTVATVQTLSRHTPDALRDHFGLVLLDEAHHCPAGTFTELIQRFTARWRIGLTATPRRADGLQHLMHSVLGPQIYRVQPAAMVDIGSLCAAQVQPIETNFAGGRLTDHTAMISRICQDAPRNSQILSVISATYGKRALVLSERVEHCVELASRLQHIGLQAYLLVGRMPLEQRQQALASFLNAPAAVLISTTSLVGEGFDCPDLDTLYLVAPSGNLTRTTQALGRVLRPVPGKPSPCVYDFVDAQTPALARNFDKRLGVYRSHRAQIAKAWLADEPLVQRPTNAAL